MCIRDSTISGSRRWALNGITLSNPCCLIGLVLLAGQESQLFNINYFKRTDTLSRKKKCMHTLQYIYDAAYKRCAKSSGKGSSITQAYYPRPLYVPRGRKTHGFFIQIYGKHSRGHISYLKAKFPSVRLLVFAHSACRYKKFCVKLGCPTWKWKYAKPLLCSIFAKGHLS